MSDNQAPIRTKKTQSMKKSAVAKDVLTLALERINYVYDLFDHIAVSFSGGKDSTVVLNLCLQVARERGKLPLHVVFYDEEAIPYEVENYVRRVSQIPDIKLDWLCLPIKHTNACSSESTSWIAWNPAERHLWVRELPPEAITSIPFYTPETGVLSIPELAGFMFPPDVYGTVGWAMGIRAAESIVRHNSVTRREKENFIIKSWAGTEFGGVAVDFGNLFKVVPIYDWETSDVWTAPAKFGWDYCEAYDLMEMEGISHHEQRVAPPYGTQPMRRLWSFKTCFPDVWEKIVRRVPGANTAAMYAHTELYSAGKVEKPEGIDWQDWIQKLLTEIDDPKMRAAIAKALRMFINRHYKLTGGAPILAYVPHPLVGVTWELLAKIVIRKDNKGRIRPDMILSSLWKDYPASLAAYETARAAYEAGLSE